jgi:hypothetical protein
MTSADVMAITKRSICSSAPLRAGFHDRSVATLPTGSSRQRLNRFIGSRLMLAKPVNGINAPQRPDCVAGVRGLELRNVGANYPIERSLRFLGAAEF